MVDPKNIENEFFYDPRTGRVAGEKAVEPLNIIAIFFREGGWYPLDLPEDSDWSKHAELNPGTLKIENLDGDILWQQASGNRRA